MNMLLQGFHPTFDALSAHADQSDVSAVRSRVGRHVARCSACSATVAEIRALGDAARDMEVPGAPVGLWKAIERTLAAGQDAPPAAPRPSTAWDAGTHRDAPQLRPTLHVPALGRVSRRAAFVALAAAAIVGALLLLPSAHDAPLQASPNVGRWRFSPSRPVPGSRVQVRFEPVPGMFADTALLLVGSSPHRTDDPVADPHPGNGLDDSLGVVRRERDGAYAGEFVFPASSNTMVVHVVDLTWRPRPRIMTTSGPVSRTPEAVALLVAGDGHGRPSLAALTEAAYLWPGRAVVRFIVSDTLIKYFPDEPIGYAADRRTASGGVIDALVAWFKRGERQYLRFDERYMAERTVSVEHELAMITFANRIDEPGELRKWTMRLAHDHPDDPRTLQVYSSMLSGMLSRAGTVDSVRRGLPLADSLWERNGHRGSGISLAAVASTVGDRESQRTWMVRLVLGGARDFQGGLFGLDDATLEDPAVRDLLQAPLRVRLSMSCVVPPGKYPLWTGVSSWESACASQRAWAYSALSALARADGQAEHALALADSSIALSDSIGRCRSTGGHRRRGEALLALGDTARAVPELAAGLGYANRQAIAHRDSLGVRLRSFIAPEAWARESALANERFLACKGGRA